MNTFSVYLIKLMPAPEIQCQKNDLMSENAARAYIRKPDVNSHGHFWVIVKVPPISEGQTYKLIDIVQLDNCK